MTIDEPSPDKSSLTDNLTNSNASIPPDGRVISKKTHLTMRRAHKWAGILSALWLAVLGFTGFLLDHREWRWIWQTGVPEFLLPQKVVDTAIATEITLYRINPEDHSRRIAAGRRGLWHSADGGRQWNRTTFTGVPAGQSPQIFSIINEPSAGWRELWFATDDGVWVSRDNGLSAERAALPGEFIGALTQGAEPGELLGVANRSRVFGLNTQDGAVRGLNLSMPQPSQLPESVSLSRFIHDLHYARGIVTGLASVIINDVGGIALISLPLTGILFWWFPLRWNRRKSGRDNHESHRAQRLTMRWLHLSHGALFGIISIIPVLYLSITGVLIDHRDELLDWMTSTRINLKWLPPAYKLPDWEMEIYSIAGYPGEPGKFSIGVRTGLYTTKDGGTSWEREKIPGPISFFVWMIRRVDGDLFIGSMGGPTVQKLEGGKWEIVKGAGHMQTDVFSGLNGERVWKSHRGFLAESGGKKASYVKFETGRPSVQGVPLFYLLDSLHSGMIFHPQWKWVNDLFALMAIILCVTGMVRFWRQRRVVSRDLKETIGVG